MSVAPGALFSTVSFDGPTDSASLLYGNGYDLCGDLEYSLSGTNGYTDEYMKFSPAVNSGSVDALKFDLESFSSGKVIKYEMELTATLQDYPLATPAVIPVTFNYRECIPFNWEFSFDEEVIEVYTDETIADIDVSVSQSPCDFT